MPIREPAWWYESSPSIFGRLLAPLAAVYGRQVQHRYRRAVPYISRLPVICVGNLVAGGTGKTPLALHIAQRLLMRGDRPAFLTRGYGGSITGPHHVRRDADLATAVGDEALLLADAAPTVVARDRGQGARAIEQTDATHIIMDDGLQNPGLAKSLTLAVVDATRGLGNGRVIPAGPLRAPLDFQMGLADVIVVSGPASSAMEDVPGIAAFATKPMLRIRRRLDGPLEALAEGSWIAFAGIGNPGGFFDMLSAAGVKLGARVTFADHHSFTAADATRLLDMAAQTSCGLVTTMKDRARLSGIGPLGQLRARVVAPTLRLELAEADEQLLDALLDSLRRPA